MTLRNTLGGTHRIIHHVIRPLGVLFCLGLVCNFVMADTAQASDPPLTLSFAPSLQNSVYVEPRAQGPVDDTLPLEEIKPTPDLPRTIDLTETPDNLWDRIRNGFGMPNLSGDLVLYHQQWYMNRPDYLRRMVERSSRYLYFIVEEIEKRGMPMELALLPMVESAYNPMAYSRSHASGLWQFIPTTGKNFKLEQNWWVDERRDIIASTSAALDYLQSIYDMHGDWQLALASYNWGEGAVGRAIAKNKARGLPTDYESLTMPSETRNYVPKLQALKNILSNPRLFADLNLQAIPNRPYFSTIAKPADIDVKMAAKLAEMPVDEFVALNPAHNRPVIKARSALVLPAEKLETFKANLENNDAPLSSWTSYTLRRGEKLDKVAARFGVSVAHLKTINGIQTKAKVGAGTVLLVPNRDGAPTELAALTENPMVQVEVPAPASASPAAKAETRTHVVKKGDTLFSIAHHYGVTVDDLKHWNKLGRAVPAGTHLVVSAPVKAAPMVATAGTQNRVTARIEPSNHKVAKETSGRASKTAKAPSKPQMAKYTIRKGDTLAGIAKKFKVDADDIRRWNKMAPSGLKPGQTLTIQLAQNDSN